MRILVTASTFPRWQGDTEPPFVFELCRRLQKRGVDIDIIAPHAPGAKAMEVMDGINVYRYRYGPERLEVLAYQGGILANLKRHFPRAESIVQANSTHSGPFEHPDVFEATIRAFYASIGN